MHSILEPVAALLRPISRAEYGKMIAAGVFGDERVELLYGAIVRMPPHGPPHDATLDRLAEFLTRAVPSGAKVRTQCAFAVSDGSEPEPDIAVVPRRDYDDAHPSQAFLVVEVAVSSLAVDRSTKARMYAESGVPEYWVVDVEGRVVEVHTEPRAGRYERVTPYRRGGAIVLVAFADVSIPIDTFLRG